MYFSLWDGASWGIGDQWMEDTSYAVNDYAKNKGVSYKSKMNHISTADDEPGVGTNWTSYWSVTTAVQDLGGIATNSYRCFDAAYEQTSNELLIVATMTGASEYPQGSVLDLERQDTKRNNTATRSAA